VVSSGLLIRPGLVVLVCQVTHVVCGEADGQGTAKHSAALQRGIPTVDEQFMLRLIKNGGRKGVGSGSDDGAAASSSGRDLKDGEEFEVPRQGADPYVIKNIVCNLPVLVPDCAVVCIDIALWLRSQGGVYSCTCQAWKFQSKPINQRTCR
jgi:hypothetical protein